MGGKTKQTNRTKNNAKASSSSRAAELLGTVPSFVGFSSPSDLGSGCGSVSTENMSDVFELNISPEFQIILRKLSKKDPMTKKKALMEFYSRITCSDMDAIKTILPLWPKIYGNLAIDSDHSVRELAQTVLQLLVSKSKRAIAPFLKELMPVWLASYFDNYAPAASIARNCFRETFAGTTNRTQEVCLHCQAEIIEYATKNLTFHTASTIANEKNLTPDEAEQKYQRVVFSSLKELCFLIDHTSSAPDLSTLRTSLEPLVPNSKFWSFSKSKIPSIKAAWFEFFYHLLQSAQLTELITPKKTELLAACFHNIDESDPLVAPQVWGCILLLQSSNDDWYATVNFKNSILPKLSWLLRNGFNKNAHAICPNLLPFFSKLSQESLQEIDLNEFYIKFFDDLKSAICNNAHANISKSDHAIIIKTYFECIRFLLQRLSTINEEHPTNTEENALAVRLLVENVLSPIAWFLSNECAWTKFFFLHAAALVAFLTDRRSTTTSPSKLYGELLTIFWERVCQLITESLESKDVTDHCLEHVTQLLNDLNLATPSLEDHYVKFAETTSGETPKKLENEGKEMKASSIAAIQKELKQLAVQLVRLCLGNINKETSSTYINHVHRLTCMFPDVEFYKSISTEGELQATLELFKNLLLVVDEKAADVIVDIIFDILKKIDKSEQFSYIQSKLLIIPSKHVKLLMLQRVVSYPLCVEPEVRTMLSQPIAREIIAAVVNDIVKNQCRENINLLHKCFFQTDAGEILIDQLSVDTILTTLSEPLGAVELSEMTDACGSFIAQIMPVVFSNQNSSQEIQREVFIKLFKFTMERTVNDFISDDTLWEITTCWQDALSSQDIIIDEALLQSCADIVERRAETASLPIDAILVMAEAMAKFITCSAEHIVSEVERSQQIDKTMATLFHSQTNRAEAVKNLEELCLYLEAVKGTVSLSVPLSENAPASVELKSIFRRTLLNFCTITKLVCRGNVTEHKLQRSEAIDDEITEDFCDPNENLLKHWSDMLIAEILQSINIASVAESLINNGEQLDNEIEVLMLELPERVKAFMREKSGIVNIVKEHMLQAATKEESVTACRSLLFLVNHEDFAQFEDSATYLLYESLSENFLTQNAIKAYLNSLQYLLPRLEQRTVTSQSAIMRTEPKAIWIKAAVFRCLVINNFKGDSNQKSDKAILTASLQFISEVAEKHHADKDLLLYNVEIHKQDHSKVLDAVEYMNLLRVVLESYPQELSVKNWDAVQVGLGAWVLSVSKSIEMFKNPKVSIFITSVYKLFSALILFINAEKQTSSTQVLQNVISEWESVFTREVNLVLFKSFYSLINLQDTKEGPKEINDIDFYPSIVNEIVQAVDLIDYDIVYNFCKSNAKLTLDNLCNFLLKNFSNPIHTLRITSAGVLRRLTQYFVAEDVQDFENKSESLEEQEALTKWHFLNRFEDYITRYDFPIRKYLSEFSFKPTEIGSFKEIDRNEALSYLILWDSMIYVCAHSPVSLRSVYTNWLHENKFEENFLHFLFRAMPVEVLRNYDSKIMNTDIFKGLSWDQVNDPKLSLDKYACHLYTEVLRRLPAVVRKWWGTSVSRQKTFVDKLTTNFVSLLICNEELKAISSKKEKHENMQVTVHNSTREVLAVYSIEEARMELVITLAQNYPLGGVKVECGKQIGGRASSRNVGMQLTIFLTHQNGTIFDGLTLWKNNLDKKFEGVEECYVCYTVIHQDTCQLPKLTCKTCKKKFHGPCLYKWFTTSSKSTCPICRNVF